MANKETIKLQNLKNESEVNILQFLNTKKKCIYGEIIKELRISSTTGQEAIYSLINKGFIKHVSNSSFIELNVNIK